jgi:hypothetical protein
MWNLQLFLNSWLIDNNTTYYRLGILININCYFGFIHNIDFNIFGLSS